MYQLQVEGMTCGGCINGVKRAVQAIDAQAEVEVDLQSQTVRVHSQRDMEAVRAAIDEAGFPVVASTRI